MKFVSLKFDRCNYDEVKRVMANQDYSLVTRASLQELLNVFTPACTRCCKVVNKVPNKWKNWEFFGYSIDNNPGLIRLLHNLLQTTSISIENSDSISDFLAKLKLICTECDSASEESQSMKATTNASKKTQTDFQENLRQSELSVNQIVQADGESDVEKVSSLDKSKEAETSLTKDSLVKIDENNNQASRLKQTEASTPLSGDKVNSTNEHQTPLTKSGSDPISQPVLDITIKPEILEEEKVTNEVTAPVPPPRTSSLKRTHKVAFEPPVVLEDANKSMNVVVKQEVADNECNVPPEKKHRSSLPEINDNHQTPESDAENQQKTTTDDHQEEEPDKRNQSQRTPPKTDTIICNVYIKSETKDNVDYLAELEELVDALPEASPGTSNDSEEVSTNTKPQLADIVAQDKTNENAEIHASKVVNRSAVTSWKINNSMFSSAEEEVPLKLTSRPLLSDSNRLNRRTINMRLNPQPVNRSAVKSQEKNKLGFVRHAANKNRNRFKSDRVKLAVPLKQYDRIESNNRPVRTKCTICGTHIMAPMGSNRMQSLNYSIIAHTRGHLKTKRFSCSLCHHSGPTPVNVKIHIKNEHPGLHTSSFIDLTYAPSYIDKTIAMARRCFPGWDLII